MAFRNTKQRYGIMSMLLHWLLAAIIIGLFASGLWMLSLDYYDPWYQDGPYYHKAVGIIVVALTLWRLIWRWLNPQPSLSDLPAWERRLAHLVHDSFYWLVFALGVTGYLISTAEGTPIDLFGLQLPAFSSHAWGQIAGDTHEYLSYLLIGLVVLHTLAALKHHFIDRKDTLKRILPTSSNSGDRP